jgi:uncharacterized membrane protein YccC
LSPSPSSPIPALQRPLWRQVLANLLVVRPLPRPRLAFSLRAGTCVALPVLIGWLAGDTTAGMMAAIGGLASLYGSGRPYLSRAVELGLVACAFGLSVGLGNWVGHAWPVAVVPVVALIAMAATWLCNALRVGPPGAYMFMLACAAGSAMPSPHLSPLQVAVLVFAGAGLAWGVHMLGALVAFRGPEHAAVQAAGNAVAAYLALEPGDDRAQARQQASLALHEAWQALVSFQPRRTPAGSTLARLRALNRHWHQLFGDVLGGRVALPLARQQAAELEAQLADPRRAVEHWEQDNLPQGRPGMLAALVEALRPGSTSRLVIVRVGVAALVAGGIGAALDLERAYWAVAAAVLMLFTGMDWQRTVQRSAERLLGTWLGLLLTGLLLWWQPQALWLVAVIFALQFSVEMLVLRNYALAAIFITATGMTLAAGGVAQADPAGYLLARGVDTLVGCLVALAVLRLMPQRQAAVQIDQQLQRSLLALEELNSHLAWAELTSAQARRVRADVSHRTFALSQAWEQAQLAGGAQRGHADARWSAVAAVQELAYRMLATAWVLEREGPAAKAHAAAMYGQHGVARVQAALRQLRRSVGSGGTVSALHGLPAFVADELAAVGRSLHTATH